MLLIAPSPGLSPLRIRLSDLSAEAAGTKLETCEQETLFCQWNLKSELSIRPAKLLRRLLSSVIVHLPFAPPNSES